MIGSFVGSVFDELLLYKDIDDEEEEDAEGRWGKWRNDILFTRDRANEEEAERSRYAAIPCDETPPPPPLLVGASPSILFNDTEICC